MGASSMNQNLNGATVVNAGGMIAEVLIQSGFNGALQMSDVTTWVNTFELDFTVVMATDGETQNALIDREWTYIVDTSTMEIVWRRQGVQFDAGESGSAAYAGMQQMLTLLGN